MLGTMLILIGLLLQARTSRLSEAIVTTPA